MRSYKVADFSKVKGSRKKSVSVVRNSAHAQKILKWFPNLKKKSIVPDNVDNYADDIKKMNRDKDIDLEVKKKRDNNKLDSFVSAEEITFLKDNAFEQGFLHSSDELLGVEKASDELIAAISEKKKGCDSKGRIGRIENARIFWS